MNVVAMQTLRNHPNHGKRVGDPGFHYTPANQTDIVKVFKQMGWVPPSELKEASNDARF
jgi:hypothetical protein